MMRRDDYLLAFFAGVVCGASVWAALSQLGSGQAICRAHNPGYECVVGWVRGAEIGWGDAAMSKHVNVEPNKE